VDLYMPGYIKAALHKYQHAAPTRPEHAPHTWNPPVYGVKTQYVENETSSPELSAKDINKLQQLTGTLLYYTRAVDPTLIMPINMLVSEQSKATSDTAEKVIKLLNYCNTHPETKKVPCIRHDTIYAQWCVVSFRKRSQEQSRGFFYMGNSADTANKLTNGAILIISTVLKHVMSSAAEAEIGAVFINAKEGAFLRTTLEEVGHP
jgi:hypothetical protein